MIKGNNHHVADIIDWNFTVTKKKIEIWVLGVHYQLWRCGVLDFAICKKHNMHGWWNPVSNWKQRMGAHWLWIHADYIYFMMTCHTERIKSMFVCNSVEFLFYHFHTRAILFFLMFLLYPFYYLFIYLVQICISF